MGYSYGMGASGRTGLSCDGCGTVGGVRKRTCPHKVTTSSATGHRHALPWCPAPAYCSRCFAERGGSKGIHVACAEAVIREQAREDAEQARYNAGERKVTAAFGDWADWVPDGMVGVHFSDGARALIPAADYQANRGGWELDYPTVLTFDKVYA